MGRRGEEGNKMPCVESRRRVPAGSPLYRSADDEVRKTLDGIAKNSLSELKGRTHSLLLYARLPSGCKVQQERQAEAEKMEFIECILI